jgi:peptide chain release factor 3
MDREGMAPLELMDILEEKLDIQVRPLSWPINQGARFKGVYNLSEESLNLFRPGQTTAGDDGILLRGMDLEVLSEHIGNENAAQLAEDVELIEGAYGEFDTQAYRSGALAPVFFRIGLNNFGVRELLNTFLDIAPAPLARELEHPAGRSG